MAGSETLTIAEIAGFKTAAVKAGIKQSGNLDLGLIVAQRRCNAAAVFTTNQVQSPAVRASREHVRNGRAQAVFVNAGNANTCTGKRGERDVRTIYLRVAEGLKIAPEAVLVCSTGIIGHPLPMDRVIEGIDQALSKLSFRRSAGRALAKAIMTTDLKPKLASRKIRVGRQEISIAGIAKGSGMIEPNMATMLCFLTTDVAIRSSLLRKALKEAVNVTFNKLSIDKHQSTSDTALILASGAAENTQIETVGRHYEVFAQALREVCEELAYQMAADAEGATCTIRVVVQGALTDADARKAVREIVDSPLARSAFHGADPNWGRIVSAIGNSGAKMQEANLTCKIAGTTVYRRGTGVKFDAKALSKKMKAPCWEVEVDLGLGSREDFCLTCDLSEEYVTINADYHT